MRFQFLPESDRLTKMEQSLYESVVNIDQTGACTMSDELLKDSLQVLSRLLEKHYGKKVIMLIDEYDVCNAALCSRRKKHFIFDSINTITAPSFR